MSEARSDEALGETRAQMPSVADARAALAIHGERENFRTVTIKFDTLEAADEFDAKVRGGGTRYAVQWALPGLTTFETVTRP